MHKIVNPMAYRISFNKLWANNWYIKNIFTFSQFIRINYILHSYIKKFFSILNKKKHIRILLINLKIISTQKQLNLILYLIWSKLIKILIKLKEYYLLKYSKNNKKIQTKILPNSILNKKKYLFYHYIFKYDYKYYQTIKNLKKKKNLIFFEKFIKYKKYFKKIWKISFLLFTHYWLNPLLFKFKKKINLLIIKLLKKNKLKTNLLIFFNYHQLANSNILNEIIIHRLEKGFSLNYIFKKILNTIQFELISGMLLGLKIILKGRIHKRGRSSFIWKQKGAMEISNKKQNVDYTANIYKTKYSICSLKVWLIQSLLKKKKIFLWI